MLTVGKYSKDKKLLLLMPLPINNTNSQVSIESWVPESEMMPKYFCGCLFLYPHFLCMYLHTCYLVGWLICVCESVGACMDAIH